MEEKRGIKVLLGWCLFVAWLVAGGGRAQAMETEASEMLRETDVWETESLQPAGNLWESPYVEFSPDGMAWTFAEPLPEEGKPLMGNIWYPEGYTVSTGISSSLEALCEGEHFYTVGRDGEIPIGSWQVTWRYANCCHTLEEYQSYYHGVDFGHKVCYRPYYSGWSALCADCGQSVLSGLVYGSKTAVSSVNRLNIDLGMYYLCPTCEHLEQGVEKTWHQCKKISKNRYQVCYQPNAEEVWGNMEPGFYMYNNETEFEGKGVVPSTRLLKNVYYRVGYVFTGWNTESDGSGTFFADEAEILNLSAENYDSATGKGIVKLYAMWKKAESTLLIDPAGGTYQGSGDAVAVSGKYGEQYLLDEGEVIPPKGYKVNFDTQGGEELEAVDSVCEFQKWELCTPAKGVLENDRYFFYGADGESDTVQVVYKQVPIILPTPTRENYDFAGWYRDAECKEQVGMNGELFLPGRDMTLYAGWAELVLQAEENKEANDEKGAVNLSWSQRSTGEKIYKLYQSMDGKIFQQIYDAGGTVPTDLLDRYFPFSEKVQEIIVPHTGFYEITAAGAQGENYGAFTGGYGGSVSGKFYLTTGEIIRIAVGRQGGKGAGVGEGYGNGGGYTQVSSDRKGTLLIAGGGGGATISAGGLPGGAIVVQGNGYEGSEKETGESAYGVQGESGNAGGGGGFQCGTSGEAAWGRFLTPSDFTYSGDMYIDSGDYSGCRNRMRADGNGICVNAAMSCGWWDPDDCGDSCTKDTGWSTATASVMILPTQAEIVTCAVSGSYRSWYFRGRTREGNWNYFRSGDVVDVSEYQYVQIYVNCYAEDNSEQTARIVARLGTSTPAYGGSSYINVAEALLYEQEGGNRMGDGVVQITALDVGFQEMLRLDGVAAPDMAAPYPVAEESVKANCVSDGVTHIFAETVLPGDAAYDTGETAVLLTFDRPEDRGTVYYHRARSYDKTTEQLSCVSNLTKTTIVTGIKGYYYVVDSLPDRQVIKADVLHAEEGTAVKFTSVEALTVELTSQEEYVHLAAVDRAGNISETVHISLRELPASWELSTGYLEIDCSNGETGETIFPALAERTWYVKADGVTPFFLSFDSYLFGAAEKYQINRQIIEAYADNGKREQAYTTKLLCYENAERIRDEKGEEWENFDKGFRVQAEGDALLGDGMHTEAMKSEDGERVSFTKAFTLKESLHGEPVRVIPRAGVAFGEDVFLSDEMADAAHGLTVIGDGAGPEIAGMEGIWGKEIVQKKGQNMCLVVTAADEVSGVREFYVKIRNLDNFNERLYYPTETGEIKIDMAMVEPLFSGDFEVTVYAVDNVGNESIKSCQVTEFGLEARIERILEPHEAVFRRGESGILYVKVSGYAEKVEILFPKEMADKNPELNRTITYDVPLHEREERIQFMIPVEIPENQNYEILVRAYKGDKGLEAYPTFATVAVSGSVLEDFRTRLR